MTIELIGREPERKQLQRLFESEEAEFIALYGRRRVGKTFLVRKTFEALDCHYFELTGQKNVPLSKQLTNFVKSLQKTFYPNLQLLPPTSWSSAFEMLTEAINKSDPAKKVVLFLDELPWLASKKSFLVTALDYIWNSEWVRNNRIKLIVCGSAASWIINNIISDRGGLHNRTTRIIQLKPFHLKEIKIFLQHRHITLNNDQILDIAMVTGGIPYYLKAIEPGKSAIQNINELCFRDSSLLYSEFDKLFDSLFEGSESYKEIITTIATKRYGITKSEILSKTKLSSSGGRFNKRLKELEEAGFIKKMVQTDYSKKCEYYRLIDEYCVFYLSWILPAKEHIMTDQVNQYWELQVQTPAWKSWSGYTFETICLKHISNIINNLGLSHLVTGAYPWRYIPEAGDTTSQQEGAQIDIILKRNDNCVTLIEIKNNRKPILINNKMAEALLKKAKIYQERTSTDEHIFIVMVTNAGIQKNNYSSEILANFLVLEDLFERI